MSLTRQMETNMFYKRASNGTHVVALIALGGLLTVGCGGSGNSSGSSAGKAFAGNYQAPVAMDRSESGVLLVVVDGNGKADLVVSTSEGIAYAGSGSIDGAGRATIVAKDAQTPSNGSETFALTFQSGTTPQMAASGSGAFAASGLSAARATTNAFAGTYAVSYDGDADGEGSLTVAQDGKITGSVGYGGSTVPVSGSLKGAGNLTFAAKGSASGADYTVQWSGAFYLTPASAAGAGTWKSSADYEGGWSVSKD